MAYWRAKGRIPDAEWKQLVMGVKEMHRREEERQQLEAEKKALEGPRIAHFYRRCSHEDSAATRLGLKCQTDRVDAYFTLLLSTYPDLQRGQWFEDAVVSGWKRRLVFRPAGEKLNLILRPGDHVIFAKVDRAFRNMQDFLSTKALWEDRKIHIHFADLAFDFSTPMGEAFLSMMVIFAQLEARVTSERMKETARKLILERGKAFGPPPACYQWVGEKGHKRLAYHPRERYLAQQAIYAHEKLGVSFRKLPAYLTALVRSEGPPAQQCRCEIHGFSVMWCRRLYKNEKAIQSQPATGKKIRPPSSDANP